MPNKRPLKQAEAGPSLLPLLAAVSIDGLQAKRVLSRKLDPAGGWWTAAAPSDPQAPFNIPFSIIL